tara:strand:- start:2884 stop:3936 length:1053 start_codon:yes stop_codon:yes gene_type:complete
MALVTNPDENLTGGQIEKILDTLLYEVLRPLVMHSKVFDAQIVYALSFIIKNKKRKISTSNSREDVVDYLSRALLTDDPVEKFEYIKLSKLERTMVFIFAKRVLDEHYKSFISQYSNFLDVKSETRGYAKNKIRVIERVLRTESRSDLFCMLSELKEAYDQYRDYVGTIVAQYLKLCSQQAKFFVETNPYNNYDIHDVRQNFLNNVVTAISKYNSDQGALTSYVKFWLLNAQTCSTSDHEYGIAYRIPPQYKKKLATSDNSLESNFSISLDSSVMNDDGEEVTLHNKIESNETVDQQLEHAKFSKLFADLARNVDPHGIGRLTLDIDEHISKEDQQKMRRRMKKQHLLKV